MSNFTNFTANRAVETKEIEIANARLDMSESTQWTGDGVAEAVCGSRACAGDASATPACHGASLSTAANGSYLQVVVEKHRRKREEKQQTAATATPVRLPVASSPVGPLTVGDAAAWPRGTVLVACPASLAYYVGAGGADGADKAGTSAAPLSQQMKKHKSWNLFRDHEQSPEGLLTGSCDEDEVTGGGSSGDGPGAEPACVEVYKFERVGTWLSCGAARPTRVGARACRAGRTARAAAAEVGAAARLVAGAPLLAVALVLRCVLQAVRDAAAAMLLALSDYGLKPALALMFNAVLHPPLVFIANLLRGIRAALRPALGFASECAAAVAVLLRAVRLVEIHYYSPLAPPPPQSNVTGPPAPCSTCHHTHHC